MAETGGLEITGGNGYIDPQKAIEKLKKHGRGLWGMQAFVALGMSAIAVITGEKLAQLVHDTFMEQFETIPNHVGKAIAASPP